MKNVWESGEMGQPLCLEGHLLGFSLSIAHDLLHLCVLRPRCRPCASSKKEAGHYYTLTRSRRGQGVPRVRFLNTEEEQTLNQWRWTVKLWARMQPGIPWTVRVVSTRNSSPSRVAETAFNFQSQGSDETRKKSWEYHVRSGRDSGEISLQRGPGVMLTRRVCPAWAQRECLRYTTRDAVSCHE